MNPVILIEGSLYVWIGGDKGTVTHKLWINNKKNIIFNF